MKPCLRLRAGIAAIPEQTFEPQIPSCGHKNSVIAAPQKFLCRKRGFYREVIGAFPRIRDSLRDRFPDYGMNQTGNLLCQGQIGKHLFCHPSAVERSRLRLHDFSSEKREQTTIYLRPGLIKGLCEFIRPADPHGEFLFQNRKNHALPGSDAAEYRNHHALSLSRRLSQSSSAQRLFSHCLPASTPSSLKEKALLSFSSSGV